MLYGHAKFLKVFLCHINGQSEARRFTRQIAFLDFRDGISVNCIDDFGPFSRRNFLVEPQL